MSGTPKTQEEMLALRPEVEALMKKQYPGVISVALGYKVRNGKVTEELAYRIYVQEKKPLSQLQPQQVIPKEHHGVPTDVLTAPVKVELADPTPCADRTQHSTLVSGITISNMKVANNTIDLGTIGFFATFTGVDPPYNIALVTCVHVVGTVKGDTIYQPSWSTAPDGTIGAVSTGADVVGTILTPAPKGADKNGNYVDAASVQLNICISSWCHTNCGVSFANQVLGLAINNSNAIKDIRNAVLVGDVVYKVGRITGRTVGKVNHVGSDIEIQATSMQTADNCGGTLRFADQGDSGSALIDSNRNLVGLVYAINANNAALAYACLLQPVLDALAVVPITENNPVHNNPAAEGMRSDVPLVVNGRQNQTAALRARFLSTDEGQRIMMLVEQHRHEVIHLVNHNRRVAVVWRRSEGPPFLNRAINNARDPEETIPAEINGVTRRALLTNISDALIKYGSPELQDAIKEYREKVLIRAEQSDNLHDLVEMLERQPA